MQLFDKLKEQQPNFEEKIIAVPSDMMEPRLGLSEEDTKIIHENITAVFHVAATIKFDEKLE